MFELDHGNAGLVCHLVVDLLRDADASCFGKGLDARGDVDGIAEYVAAPMDDVTHVYSYPEVHPPFRWEGGVSFAELLLNLHRALDGLECALKLGEE